MYLALHDEEAVKYEAGDIVRLKKEPGEMRVLSHQEGTVRCEFSEGGVEVQQNFSAAQLQLVRKG